MPAAGGLAFAAAHRMINRVHYNTAIMRLFPQPPRSSGFADTDIFVLIVSNLSDGRHAFNKYFTHFS
jgi:hypothetical protein